VVAVHTFPAEMLLGQQAPVGGAGIVPQQGRVPMWDRLGSGV
jgi:hypothetical protein